MTTTSVSALEEIQAREAKHVLQTYRRNPINLVPLAEIAPELLSAGQLDAVRRVVDDRELADDRLKPTGRDLGNGRRLARRQGC